MICNKILVPIDFSDCSINALKMAISLAKRSNAQLIIYHAIRVSMAVAEFNPGDTMVMNEEVEEEFETLIDKIPDIQHIKYTQLSKFGDVPSTINTIIKTEKIDLIVMGTKGVSGIKEVLIGSNAYEVVRHSDVPVLIIPDNAPISTIKHIALASDYKPLNAGTIEPLKGLIRLFGAEIHVLHIGRELEIANTEMSQAMKLKNILKNVNHHYHFIVNENVQNGLNNYCYANKIDILAMVPRKHNFFDKMFKGGETKNMIFHSHKPVLALPA